MNTQNVTPSPEPQDESAAQASKWTFLTFLALILALPTIGLMAIFVQMAWSSLEKVIPVLTYFFALCLVIATIGLFLHLFKLGKARIERYQQETYVFPPDTQGNYAAMFDKDAKTFIQAIPGNYQVVPQTYSPHLVYQYKDSSQRLLPEQTEQTAIQASIAPSIEEVVTSLPRNGLQLSLGRSLTTGELLSVELPDSHLKLIGASRKGKSSLAGGLLEQVQRTHDPNTLQFALLDLEYKTSRLFERSPHVAYMQAGRRGKAPAIARDANEVALWLKWLYQEMERRYKMTAQQLAQAPYVLVYLEEFLELRRRLKGPALNEAIDNFTSLATRGLKMKLSLLCCAQVDYSSELLRDAMAQFVGCNVAFAVKPDAARAAGMISSELLNRNYAAKIPGQYVVESTGFTDLGVSPQYDVRQKLSELDGMIISPQSSAYHVQGLEDMPELSTFAPSMHPLSTTNAPENLHQVAPAWQAFYDQVVTLYEQGYRNQDTLIEKVFGIKKGGNEKWYGCRDIVQQCLIAMRESEESQ